MIAESAGEPLKIKVRPERASDCAVVRAIHRESFGREDEATLVDVMRRRADFDPALSLLAENAGLVVGHILFSRVVVSDGEQTAPALSLAPMAVLPRIQRRGIGSRLVRDGLRACGDQGHDLVFVLGHPDFYSRFGFVPAHEFGIRAPWTVPSEAYRVIELRSGALQGVRGVVRYPDCFDL